MDQQIVAVLHPVLEALVAALVAVLLGLATKYLQKVGIAVDAQKFFQQREVAHAIVVRIEEQYAAMRKNNEPAMTTKLDAAVEALLQKLPGITKEYAKELVDEAVARAGLGASARPTPPSE